MNGTVSEHIVIIEDDPANREGFRRILQKAGYRVTACGTADEGLEELRRAGDVTLIITDLRMPGKDGMAVLAEARAIDSRVGLLMVTAHGTVPLAVEAIKQGADDFLLKPIDDIEQLRLKVAAVLRTRHLERENVELRTRIGELASLGGLIGRAASMQRLYKQIEMVSPTRSTVLIIGESGTGKELVANAIHENSPRRSERFLPINCGAIPGDILESELFGHEKGSFTGAASRKIGKFELADRGTIFLDEIGELPSDMQVKLLRVLEGMEFMRVGGTETIRVDVRVLAATNADLESAVSAGRFRSDLYYRLKVVTIKIPPLRERREDIPVLIEHFLRRYSAENRREGLSLSPAVLRMLVNHPWEGNVRELKNLIESLVVLAPGSSIDVGDLPAEYLEGAGTRMGGGGMPGPDRDGGRARQRPGRSRTPTRGDRGRTGHRPARVGPPPPWRRSSGKRSSAPSSNAAGTGPRPPSGWGSGCGRCKGSSRNTGGGAWREPPPAVRSPPRPPRAGVLPLRPALPDPGVISPAGRGGCRPGGPRVTGRQRHSGAPRHCRSRRRN